MTLSFASECRYSLLCASVRLMPGTKGKPYCGTTLAVMGAAFGITVDGAAVCADWAVGFDNALVFLFGCNILSQSVQNHCAFESSTTSFEIFGS